MRPWFIISLGEHSKHASFIKNYEERQYFNLTYDSHNHHRMISEDTSSLESRETHIYEQSDLVSPASSYHS